MTPEGLVLIDPIALADPDELPAPPAAILLTSANHARAAGWWRGRTGARIYALAEALPELEVEPVAPLEDGELAPGGFRVVALPGGAPGETAYVGHGICAVGDAVINMEGHGFALLPAKYCTDAPRLPQSLKKLLSCEFSILTFAHGTPLVQNARARLSQLLA